MKVKLEVEKSGDLFCYIALSCKTKYNSTYFNFMNLTIFGNGNYCDYIRTFPKDAKIKYRFCQVNPNKIVKFAESIENYGECNIVIDSVDSSLFLEAVKPIAIK